MLALPPQSHRPKSGNVQEILACCLKPGRAMSELDQNAHQVVASTAGPCVGQLPHVLLRFLSCSAHRVPHKWHALWHHTARMLAPALNTRHTKARVS